MEIFIFLPLLAKSTRWNRLALSFQQLECLKLDFDTILKSILMNDLASNQKNLSVNSFRRNLIPEKSIFICFEFERKWKSASSGLFV